MPAEKEVDQSEKRDNLAVFKLEREPIQKALDWTGVNIPNHRHLTAEIARLEGETPSIHAYITIMSKLRRELQSSSSVFLSAYDNGALFMLKAVEMQYEAHSSPMPTLSYNNMVAYLSTLLGSEWNGLELSSLGSIGRDSEPQSTTDDEPIETPEDTALTFKELKDHILMQHDIRLITSFTSNSEILKKQMLERESFVKEVLTNGSFVKMYGPGQGLHLGALDIYQAYSDKHENGKLQAMWDVPVT